LSYSYFYSLVFVFCNHNASIFTSNHRSISCNHIISIFVNTDYLYLQTNPLLSPTRLYNCFNWYVCINVTELISLFLLNLNFKHTSVQYPYIRVPSLIIPHEPMDRSVGSVLSYHCGLLYIILAKRSAYRIRVGAKCFAFSHTGRGKHQASCTVCTESYTRAKQGTVALTTHSHIPSRSKKCWVIILFFPRECLNAAELHVHLLLNIPLWHLIQHLLHLTDSK
jgi:uncharacterized membrane protein